MEKTITIREQICNLNIELSKIKLKLFAIHFKILSYESNDKDLSEYLINYGKLQAYKEQIKNLESVK